MSGEGTTVLLVTPRGKTWGVICNFSVSHSEFHLLKG